jgi:hypothetical protein
MRISITHLLLVAAAVAAPIQEIDRGPERRHDNPNTPGLIPILARTPIAPIRPVRPVEPVAPVRPVGPDPVVNPGGPDTPGGLRPNEPVVPSPNEPEAPGDIRLGEPTNPVKPNEPEPPGTLTPDDPANTVNPNEPETVGGAKPDDDSPLADLDPSQGCLLKRCVDPKPLEVNAKSRWKTNKVEEKRLKGSRAHQKLDEVIKDAKEDTGLKHLETDPSKQLSQVLNEKNMYNAKSELNPNTMPDLAYLQHPMFEGKFKPGEQWPESTVRNNDAQVKEFDNWRSGHEDKLKTAANNDKDKIKNVDYYFQNDLVPGKDTVMLRTFENPSKGTIVIKDSFNEKNDFYLGYDYKFEDVSGGPPQTITRPATGTPATTNKKRITWTDQTMANWRAACTRDGVDVKSLKYMARDNIVTTDTQKVFMGVEEQMGWKQGQAGVLTVRRNAENVKEAASFDAVAGTVHGHRPILMAADHHVELGGLKVNAFHIFIKPGPLTQYNMVIEFGH